MRRRNLVECLDGDIQTARFGDPRRFRRKAPGGLDTQRIAVLRANRLGDLVLKPRTGHGGVGIVSGPHATPEQLRSAAATVERDPGAFVAQELIALSRHPTIRSGRLAPRHVDLRPFIFHAGDALHVLPGGLTRVAFDEGSLVVNSSQNGGAKDTWVLP